MAQLWMNARQLLSQTEEFSGAEGFLRGNCIIFNPHTPAVPCFPQQQRLLSHLKGSTAPVQAENTSLARDGVPQAAASALNQPHLPLQWNWQFTNLRYLWHRMSHQGSAHLYHSLAPDTQPGLTLPDCSLFCILAPLLPKVRTDLLFYQESLELLLIPWRLLSSLCPHCPSRQATNPHQNIQVLQGTYTHLEIRGASETLEKEVQMDALINLSTSTPSQSLWMVPSEQDTPE